MTTNQKPNAADTSDLADRSAKLVERIKPFLRGQGGAVQSAALADLVSMWLAGHVIMEEVDSAERPHTDAVREAVLNDFVALVRKLTPINEQIILEKISGGKGGLRTQ